MAAIQEVAVPKRTEIHEETDDPGEKNISRETCNFSRIILLHGDLPGYNIYSYILTPVRNSNNTK
jgi:hypothetical protein